MRSDELYHHGILGQKWGKRNGPPYPLNPSDRSSAEKRLAKDADKQKKKEMRNAVKNRRQLSDDELNKRIKRLESEKRLKELTNSEINRGRGFVKDFASTNGKKIAGTVLLGTTMYLGKLFVSSITKGEKGDFKIKLSDIKANFDTREFVNYTFQKPKTK